MLAAAHADNPPEALSRPAAVEAYTPRVGVRRVREQVQGTLEPGQLADLAVPSDDIFHAPSAALSAAHSMLTIVGGRVVFDDGTVTHEVNKGLRQR